jgi:TolB-like protein
VVTRRIPFLVVLLLPLALAAGRAEAAGARVRVAVLPLAVNSLEAEDHLRAGLADMLASRLGQMPGVAVIRVEEAGLATTDAGKAVAAGREVGADYVLFGSFTHFGAGASLDVQCASTHEADDDAGAARRIFVQSGTLGEIIPKLDELTGKVARFVENGRGDEAPGLPAAGPGEVEALRQRVESLEGAIAELRRARVPEVEVGGSGAALGQATPEDPPDPVR